MRASIEYSGKEWKSLMFYLLPAKLFATVSFLPSSVTRLGDAKPWMENPRSSLAERVGRLPLDTAITS